MIDPSVLKKDCVLLLKFVPDELWSWCQRLNFDGFLYVIFDGGVTGYLLQFEHSQTRDRVQELFCDQAQREQSLINETITLLGRFPKLQP